MRMWQFNVTAWQVHSQRGALRNGQQAAIQLGQCRRQREAVDRDLANLRARRSSAASAAIGGEDRSQSREGERQALLEAKLGQSTRSEARLTEGDVSRRFPFGEQRLLVAHAPDGMRRQHTVFAVMTYDPGLAQWYPADMVDRPTHRDFAWAQMPLVDGQHVFAWDALPTGRELYIDGHALHAQDAAGAVVWNQEACEVEVR